MILLDAENLTVQLDALRAMDPAFAAALAQTGPPPLRRWPAGFATLVDIILGQQISTAAARTLRARLVAEFDALTPEALTLADPERLRRCGLSRQKIAYIHDLSRRVCDRQLDLDKLALVDDDMAIAQLTAVKGLGRWSAEIYLLFALGRCDVWPAEDLALQVAVQHLRLLPDRPNGRQCRILAEGWRPQRSAAACFCWHLYHHLTDRDTTKLAAPKLAAPPSAA